MKGLGNLSTFLGIQAIPSSVSFLYTQQQYVDTNHQWIGMQSCHPMLTPAAIKPTPTVGDLQPYSNTAYFW